MKEQTFQSCSSTKGQVRAGFRELMFMEDGLGKKTRPESERLD